MSALRFFQASAAALMRERFGSPRGIYALQQRRLRALLTHAATRVPFYQRRFAGVDVRTAPLAALPPVTKAELMSAFDDTVSQGAVTLPDAQAFGRDKALVGKAMAAGVVLAVTSGTTGEVGYFLTDAPGWALMQGTMFARLLRWRLLNPFDVLRFGPWRRYRMGFVTATGGHYISYLLSLHQPVFARLMMAHRAFNILTPLPQMCQELQRFQPHFLHGYPTFMEALAHEQIQGRLAIAPEVITLGSEPVTPGARVALKTAFPSAAVIETYGATECAAMAAECAHGNMHINEDVCILENVDAQGAPVPDGALGSRVYVTNLLAYTQPVIRYELADQVVMNAPHCACGSPLRTIKVLGRTDDTIYLRGGDARFHAHTPIPFEVLFLDVEGLRQYQLTHAQQNQLAVTYTRDPAISSAHTLAQLQAHFSDYLASNGLDATVEVTFHEADEIPRDPNTRKLRQIVSRVPPPANASELSGPWRLGVK